MDLGTAAITGATTFATPVMIARTGPAPANDNFANAAPISLDVTTSGTLVGSTVESHEYDTVVSDPSTQAYFRTALPYTVWYKVTIPTTGTYSVDVYTDAWDGSSDSYNPVSVVYYQSSTGGTSDTLDNITCIGSGVVGSSSVALSAGVAYVQVAYGPQQTNPNQTADIWGLPDFTVLAQKPPPVLDADITGYAVSYATIGLPAVCEASVTGQATVTVDLARNAYYANVAGTSHASADLRTDANSHVEPYDGDPTAPPGGSVTAPGTTEPNVYTSEPAVAVFEAVGPTASAVMVETYVNLMAHDRHSTDTATGFSDSPIGPATSGTLYTCERWIRLRFQAPFNTVTGLRVWTPDTAALAAGWAIKWGTVNSYATPSTSASSIATSALPSSDPGLASPNVMSTVEEGTSGDIYSPWIVIQASVNLSIGSNPQPHGWSVESWDPIPLQLQMAWTET